MDSGNRRAVAAGVFGWCCALAFLLWGAPVLSFYLAIFFPSLFCEDAREHDRTLARYAAGLDEVDHYPGSVLIGRVSRVGLLEGGGNHCDYFVGQARWCDAARADVLKHYEPRAVQTAGLVGTVPVQVSFFDNDSPGFLRPLEDLNDLEGWGRVPRDCQGGVFFIVYAIDAGYPPGEDIRCH